MEYHGGWLFVGKDGWLYLATFKSTWDLNLWHVSEMFVEHEETVYCN